MADGFNKFVTREVRNEPCAGIAHAGRKLGKEGGCNIFIWTVPWREMDSNTLFLLC